MRRILCLIPILLLACTTSYTILPTASAEAQSAPTVTVTAAPTTTLLPTLAATPTPTNMSSDPSDTIVLDFVAQLCIADWMNGAVHLSPCPGNGVDQSGGYAKVLTALPRGFPRDTQALLMIPNANALFLRYPAFSVKANDRFRTTLLCGDSAPCDVQFAFDYYDARGKFHNFVSWDYKTGDAPIKVDLALGDLAGQSVDFVLTLRLFHQIEDPQHDNGLWAAPHIYRPAP